MTTYAPPKPEVKKVREGYRLSFSYHTPYENASYQVDTKRQLSKKKIKRWVERIISTMPADYDL